MPFYSVLYRFKTRRWFGEGKWKESRATFVAKDLAQAMALAKFDGEVRYRKRQWALMECKKL